MQNKIPCLEWLSQLLKSLMSCGPLLPEIGKKRETRVPTILGLRPDSWLRTRNYCLWFLGSLGGNLLNANDSESTCTCHKSLSLRAKAILLRPHPPNSPSLSHGQWVVHLILFADSSPFELHPQTPFFTLLSPLGLLWDGVGVGGDVDDWPLRTISPCLLCLLTSAWGWPIGRERVGVFSLLASSLLLMVPAVAGFSTGTAKMLGKKGPLPWLRLSPTTAVHLSFLGLEIIMVSCCC